MTYPHPDYLLPLLTSTQFDDWQLYHRIEPFGQHRSDLMAGMVAAGNADLWAKEGGSRPSPYDYMPGYDEPEPTEEDIQAGTMNFLRNMRR